jgi:cytoskeleton protein RodZ
MNELPENRTGAGLATPPAANDGVTAGTLLRRAREASGLHVEALAVSLKVPVRKLEALEDDRHDLLTDAVFVRALASTVCRTLRIDPQPVMMRLPQSQAPRLMGDIDGINTPFRTPGDGAAPTWLDHLNRPVVVAVLGLLLGALVLILMPTANQEPPAAPSKTGMGVDGLVREQAPAIAAAESAPQAGQGLAAVVAPPELANNIVQVSVPAAAASQPGAAAVVPFAPAVAASAAVPVAAAPEVPASGLVVLRAKGQSWVEVTDAKGAVALRKTLSPGEAAAASGALPLQVTIGRVDATEVQVRGKPFDLRAVSKDNVARFEVK